MNKFFKLSQYGTNITTEVQAGIVTFLAMAYIIVVNPLILADAGIPLPAAFFATVVIAGIGTISLGLRSNMPIAVAPGMGLNAFFTYTVVKGMGIAWEVALAAVFVSGLIFIAIAATGLRKRIIDAIPEVLKHAIVVSVGIFIAFIGFREAGVVVSPPVNTAGQDTLLLQLGNVHAPTFLLTVMGIIITLILVIKRSRFAIIGGIFSVVILQFLLTVSGVLPKQQAIQIDISHSFDALGQSILALPQALKNPTFYPIVFTFLFLDFFDTTGTLIATTSKLKRVSETETEVDERISKAMIVDACATTTGAVLGTTSVTAYLESLAGMDAGGRSGLTSVVTGILLLASFFLYPFIGYITPQATAPALIMVGIFMMQTLHEINFEDLTEVSVLFFTMLITLFSTSIAAGIAVGFIMYIIVMMTKGKARKLDPVVWLLGGMFLLQFIFGHVA